jgi:hypothetical protein
VLSETIGLTTGRLEATTKAQADAKTHAENKKALEKKIHDLEAAATIKKP